MTEHRTAVIGNISYPAPERVYSMLGETGRTDIGWTFTGLPATILKPASPVTMVHNILIIPLMLGLDCYFHYWSRIHIDN
jgi:hypothetical protein